MKRKWFILFTFPVITLVCFLGTGNITAAAQDGKTAENESCLSCHAGLYMLHDTGKWYCMCGTQACCVDCHGGVVGAYDYDGAHSGLIAYPLREDAAICQKCHGTQTSTYVNQFIAMGVLKPTPVALANYDSGVAVEVSGTYKNFLKPQPREPWRQAGLAGVVICMFGLSIFAVRCCIEDRASKKPGSSQ